MSRSYCLAIHVPIHVDGGRSYVASEWHRALCLLRDSLASHFDRFLIVAPTRSAESSEHELFEIGSGDGFVPRPSISRDGGKRDYWLRDRRRWRADVAAAFGEAEIAHVGAGDLYRPINFDAAWLAFSAPVTTVFVRDTDTVTQMRDLIAQGNMRGGFDRRLYERLYDGAVRRAVARADLALLKGRALYDRYARFAGNAYSFQNTSYSEAEIVKAELVERRIDTLAAERPVRFVYCGRLVARKGLSHAISIVAGAAAMGANLAFDVIGDGEERPRLAEQIAREGVSDRVRLLGRRSYGANLLEELSGYDALLFTPLSEDTPRMIFDGYAAGLPLVGYDIPYVRERAAEEGATEMLPFADPKAGANVLTQLVRDRSRLAALARMAHAAAYANSAEAWYRRRAKWTLEAHARRQRARSGS